MNFLGKAFVFSILVLVASIFFGKCILSRIDNEQKSKCFMGFLAMVMKIDDLLKSIHIDGFHRGVEYLMTNAVFYTTNTSGLNVEVKMFDGVEVLIFDPIEHEPNRRAIIHFHGSGWAYFNPKFFTVYLSDLARRLNTLIVSVNYRKAPEHPYPAGFDDSLAATKYFMKNCELFSVNPDRIALMGDSAGGNLVVAVGHHLSSSQDNGIQGRLPKILVPVNPSLQMVDTMTPSFLDDRDVGLPKRGVVEVFCLYAFGRLSKEQLNECIVAMATNRHLSADALQRVKDNVDWTRYLSGDTYKDHQKSTFEPPAKTTAITERLSQLVTDPLFSPLSALSDAQLKALPLVYLFVASRDPLRDDAKIMAARLSSVGRLGAIKEADYYHGSFLMPGFHVLESRLAYEELVRLLSDEAVL